MGDLTTLANVKARLGLTATTTDALLSSLITEVSTLAQTYIGYAVLSANYSETFDGAGQRAITLGTTPVISVSGVQIGTQSIPQATDLVSPGYVATPKGISFRNVWVQAGVQNIQVSYVAGYSVVPPDLEMSVIDLVCLVFEERSRMGQVSISMGGQSTRFLNMADGIPKRILAVWSAYQRWSY